jgi:hypothetical protein
MLRSQPVEMVNNLLKNPNKVAGIVTALYANNIELLLQVHDAINSELKRTEQRIKLANETIQQTIQSLLPADGEVNQIAYEDIEQVVKLVYATTSVKELVGPKIAELNDLNTKHDKIDNLRNTFNDAVNKLAQHDKTNQNARKIITNKIDENNTHRNLHTPSYIS